MSLSATASRQAASDPRDRLQFTIAFTTVLTARLWRVRFADRMKALGQTDARWTVLTAIAGAPEGIIQTQLADLLGIQCPTLVRLLDGLAKQGLINRREAANDRRANIIAIEAKGRAMLVELDGFASQLRADIFAGLTDSDLEAASRVLSHLANHLGPHRAKN